MSEIALNQSYRSWDDIFISSVIFISLNVETKARTTECFCEKVTRGAINLPA